MQKTVPVLVVVLQASTIIGGREGVIRGHSSRDQPASGEWRAGMRGEGWGWWMETGVIGRTPRMEETTCQPYLPLFFPKSEEVPYFHLGNKYI